MPAPSPYDQGLYLATTIKPYLTPIAVASPISLIPFQTIYPEDKFKKFKRKHIFSLFRTRMLIDLNLKIDVYGEPQLKNLKQNDVFAL